MKTWKIDYFSHVIFTFFCNSKNNYKMPSMLTIVISQNSVVAVYRYFVKYPFCKIHRKTLVLESLFNKAAGLQHVTLLKRDASTGVFLWTFQRFLKITFYRTPPEDSLCKLKLSSYLTHLPAMFFFQFKIKSNFAGV